MTDKKDEDWTVGETWDGDGSPGACFAVPGTDLSVFVTAWTQDVGPMTKEQFELAVKIRDLLKAEMTK